MVPYLSSIALVVVGLLVLGAVLVAVLRAVRRFAGAAAAASGRVTDRTGLLRARTAAVGVAIRQRRRARIQTGAARVPSGEPVQTGGRP
ncbi:MAG TPA: bacteriophage holin [Actinophytocola sp.]|uniref:bacteriophage holin n=1 Tax=Actinophytocola sp. TaxID=1872138 RepID=UPI002DDCD9F3|nr:bacteriophage holin [Actinophytocola sp.]HEV2783535.1 bacteriophage holin [Actinophytocola sp.]